MIEPVLADDVWLADVRADSRDPDQFRMWWLGQSGFLLQWQDAHLLFDPYLSDSLTRKYQQTDKPHVRMTRRVIDPARLEGVQVVTASHHHTDHLDSETLQPLLRANPALRLVVPAAHTELAAQRAGVPPQRLDPIDAGTALTIGPFHLHAIPAAHEAVERDRLGRHLFLGYIVQFGPWTVYHSGDTVRYAEQLDWLNRWRIDIALLPINGRAPERRVAGNLWGREAAQLARDAHVRCAIPCHYEMFTFNTADPAEFVATCRQLGQPYDVLRAGQRWSSRELAECESAPA
jgi:L-ascorbate metabolism protein UlaG (beta-lactamase superfamily)